ncbi:hypothetical protein SPI_08795 [Niveomyces insectorum RCEF 264]|uniref:HNH nuclease domain-containing protein n=1 Tax=Niveomyces insectorum RCEF 264 TaxID=1081102 RepID=A0A167MMU4_9HYPO|nr:hypothetical protein SPI_08795 [Niveomyces insectorum RCEF 264]
MAAHHRHQASLEHIIYPTEPAPLSTAQRANARRILYQLVDAFGAVDNVRSTRTTFIHPRLDTSRQAALAILNMFDLGVAYTIDGVDIDRPRNAMTLTTDLHYSFGNFEVYFEPVPGAYNTYYVRSFLPPPSNRSLGLPVQRELFVTDTRTIDPPSPRLLAVHRAIAYILHLSGAGDYIDAILRDLEYGTVRADGSSELGRMVSLVLGDWAAASG